MTRPERLAELGQVVARAAELAGIDHGPLGLDDEPAITRLGCAAMRALIDRMEAEQAGPMALLEIARVSLRLVGLTDPEPTHGSPHA